MNEEGILARQQLVVVAQSMLNGDLSFLEGTAQVLAIKRLLGEVGDRDSDFDAFLVIRSETDHLPLKEHWAQWSAEAVTHLEPECQHTEEWARSFAPQSCKNLIERFKIT